MVTPANCIFDRSPALDLRSDVVLLRAAVDLDVVAETTARFELSEMCNTAVGPRWILMFLGRNRFVDLRGLDVLLDAAGAAHRHDRGLVIVAPPHSLVRLLEVLGLQKRLTLAESAWDAALLIGADVSALPHDLEPRERVSRG